MAARGEAARVTALATRIPRAPSSSATETSRRWWTPAPQRTAVAGAIAGDGAHGPRHDLRSRGGDGTVPADQLGGLDGEIRRVGPRNRRAAAWSRAQTTATRPRPV